MLVSLTIHMYANIIRTNEVKYKVVIIGTGSNMLPDQFQQTPRICCHTGLVYIVLNEYVCDYQQFQHVHVARKCHRC